VTTTAVAAAREHDVRLPGGRRIHVREAGDPRGDVVLVHHGTPSSGLLATWWAQDAAARGIRLVSYDRPGYGLSDRHPGRQVADAAADCAAIADALGANRFRTWGVSGGGPHALACAALLPDRVIAAAAVASVAPYTADNLDWLGGMGSDNLDEFGQAVKGESALRPYLDHATAEFVRTSPDALVDAMLSILGDPDVALLRATAPDAPPVAELLTTSMTEGLRAGVDGWLDDDLAFVAEWGFDVAEIRVPVLVLQGRHDLMVPFTHGAWLAATVPGVAARLTDTDGHLTLLTRVSDVHSWLMQHS
jgi:pimeloyl-ACP methyl ester carboxylesterase